MTKYEEIRKKITEELKQNWDNGVNIDELTAKIVIALDVSERMVRKSIRNLIDSRICDLDGNTLVIGTLRKQEVYKKEIETQKQLQDRKKQEIDEQMEKNKQLLKLIEEIKVENERKITEINRLEQLLDTKDQEIVQLKQKLQEKEVQQQKEIADLNKSWSSRDMMIEQHTPIGLKLLALIGAVAIITVAIFLLLDYSKVIGTVMNIIKI